MLDAQKLLADLTEPQRQAVTHVDGPLLIVAGAGSGKTRVITRRVAYLMSQGIPGSTILAITFTNKAAGEMKSRVGQLLGRELRDFGKLDQPWPLICTFHSLGLRILRHYAAKVGLPAAFSVYDTADQERVVKDAVKAADLSTENFPPSMVLGQISNAKNRLQLAKDFAASVHDFAGRNIARIYAQYEKLLKKNHAVDFDDLLMRTVLGFRDHADMLAEVQSRFQYILIDEFQDTNHAQYMMAHLLALKHRNICVVGDPDQCLPRGTRVQTARGARRIESISQGDIVQSGTGWAKTSGMAVEKAMSRRYRGPLVRIRTKGGHEVRGTPNHIGFARLRPDPFLHYTYLMYRRGVGYRLGTTRGVRASKDGLILSGVEVRANQEVADAVWMVHASRSAPEARYFEQFYAARYGIPTMVFHVRGRRMAMTQEWVDRLYREIDTEAGAERLLDDLHMDRRYPHHRVGAVTRAVSGQVSPWSRRRVMFTMFGDPREFIQCPWHEHRIQMVTSDTKLRAAATGKFRVRDGVRRTWRIETSRKGYEDGLALSRAIAALAPDVDLVPRARLAPNKAFLFMPLSHILPGMVVPVSVDGEVREDIVTSVEWEEYSGTVYDLSVPNTRNYVAGGIVVHNSIYAWRGADIRNILDFEKDYPDAKVVRLEQNYRSTKAILAIASKLIARNRQRKDKALWTENPDGAPAQLLICSSEHDEAAAVVQRFEELHRQGHDWSHMAVFYRVNALMRVMEDALRRARIPYRVARGVAFFQRKEIKDVLAYLRVIANPDDEVSLERIINTPARGISDATVKQLQVHAAGSGAGLWDGMLRVGQIAGLQERARNAVNQFVALVQRWQSLPRSPVRDLMEDVVRTSGYEKHLKKLGGQELDELGIVNELITSATEYDLQNPEGSLEQYLSQISLLSDVDGLKDNGGAVTLMTLHAAKGLEFPVVAIIGMEEGLLPHSRVMEHPEQLEEERRLCFVGVTRAQQRLILSQARSRMTRGQTLRTIASRFLAEMPAELIDVLSVGAEAHRHGVEDDMEELTPEFRRGQMVRHPRFGVGRIVEISRSGQHTRAVVEFQRAGRKTLILQYANLEPLG